MAKYRKKPVVVEAFQWDGMNVQALADWAAKADLESRKARGITPPPGGEVVVPLHITSMPDHGDRPAHIRLEVGTINGIVEVNVGEYVICGVGGEFYPCDPKIFAETYEDAEPKVTVFRRPECVFVYCPHPDACEASCVCSRDEKRS